MDPDDGSSLFRNDASFSQRAGLADASAVSFESLNFADRYIRQSDSLLRLEQISTTTDRSDASYYLV